MGTNISALSVAALTNGLGALYVAMIRQNMRMTDVPAVFLWGPPGIGKSAAVRQIADNIEKATGKKTHVTDIRLLLFSPIELRGVPVPDAEREFTKWLRPKLFDLSADEDVVNLLFLDELSAAPPAVQAAAYQITLDRTVGEHSLPDNTIVIAAGNRVTDRSVAYQMPKALANRLMHFEIKVDFESFREWAVKMRLHPLVLGYLSFDSSKLYQETDADDKAFPTPRSWKFVSDVLKASGAKLPSDIHPMIAGCVGLGAALEFEGWCRVYQTLPDIDEIFDGRGGDCPRQPDVMCALISSLTSRILEDPDRITDRNLGNICQYLRGLPVDFAAKFYRDIMTEESMKTRLMTVPAYREWMKRNRKFM